MPNSQTHRVNLLDFLSFVLRWRVFLGSVALISAVVISLYSFIVTPKYRSIALVRASEAGEQSFGSFVSQKLALLGNIGGFAPKLGEVSGEFFMVILKSRWMSESVIEKFNLRQVYELEDALPEEVVEELASRTNFEFDGGSSTMMISVDDTDPERARAMADFYVDQLDARNRSFRTTQASKEREFVGKRLDEARATLTALEDSLFRFQSSTGVLNVEEQVKATIQAAANLEAKRLLAQSELEFNRQVLDANHPEINFLRLKLASLDSSLQRLVNRRDQEKGEFDFLMRLKDTPEQGLTYVRLMRDIEVQQILIGFLIQQFEQARIEEVRNTPTIFRVDAPMVANKRIWPRRGLMVLLGTMGALILALLYALSVETFRVAANDPAHPQYNRVRDLKASLTRKKKQSDGIQEHN